MVREWHGGTWQRRDACAIARLAAAAAMTADDADFQDAGQYTSAAFSTMKKAAAVAKPPELHIADYMGKDDPMVAQVKTADREARKASRK